MWTDAEAIRTRREVISNCRNLATVEAERSDLEERGSGGGKFTSLRVSLNSPRQFEEEEDSLAFSGRDVSSKFSLDAQPGSEPLCLGLSRIQVNTESIKRG